MVCDGRSVVWQWETKLSMYHPIGRPSRRRVEREHLSRPLDPDRFCLVSQFQLQRERFVWCLALHLPVQIHPGVIPRSSLLSAKRDQV